MWLIKYCNNINKAIPFMQWQLKMPSSLKLIMAFFCLAGIGLRLYHLDIHSFWGDEMFTAINAHPDLTLTQFFTGLGAEITNPPLHNFLMWLWYHIFPYTEFWGRLLSVILGIAVLPIIYQIAKYLFNRTAAIYSVIIAAVNYQLIEDSREARYGALLVFLSMLSYLFFIKSLNRPCLRNYAIYCVSSILLLYTHYFGFLVITAQGVYIIYLMLRRDLNFLQIRNLAICYALMALSLMALINEVIKALSLSNINSGAPDEITFYLLFPFEVIKWFYKGDPLTIYFTGFIVYAIVVTIIANIRIKEKQQHIKNLNGIIMLLLLPVTIFTIIYALTWATTNNDFFAKRYYVENALAFIVIPACGISIAGTWARYATNLLLCAILGYFLIFSDYYSPNKDTSDWRQAAQTLSSNPYPKVLFSNYIRQVSAYYFNRYGEYEIFGLENIKDICLTSNPCIFWLVADENTDSWQDNFNFNNITLRQELTFSRIQARLYEVSIIK